MSKTNRERRAAKARKRDRYRQGRGPGSRTGGAHAGTGGSESPGAGFFTSVEDRFLFAIYAYERGDHDGAARVVAALAALPVERVAGAVSRMLEMQVANAWARGWQPADLYRLARRQLKAGDVDLLCRVIAAQSLTYRGLGDRVDEVWMNQLELIGAGEPPGPSRSCVIGGADLTAEAWSERLSGAVRLECLMMSLPSLPHLRPPPSEWGRQRVGVDASMPTTLLDRVRALLAKAESTTFDAEAEAFTAKAQELMTRHRIDRAMLAAGGDSHETPVGYRIGVDDPYADAKAALLDGVAGANGCRAVWARHLCFSTVFGFADQLEVVDTLFTSLLVQASAALRREGSKQDRWGRSRTRSFRQSFWVAFAVRIGQRLREAADSTLDTAEAELGGALLPALAARDARVDAAAHEAYPDMTHFSPSATDPEGWHAGTLFGEIADVSAGPVLVDSTANGSSGVGSPGSG